MVEHTGASVSARLGIQSEVAAFALDLAAARVLFDRRCQMELERLEVLKWSIVRGIITAFTGEAPESE